MAQHDYLLDNALGAAFLADLNAALLAIGSSNSGTVAPVAPTPGMLWFDTLTSPGVMRMRNAQNTDWLAVAVGAGFLPLAGGTITGALAVAGIFRNFDFDAFRVSNAGTTPPATPAGGQLWYDTTTTAGALKIRDVGNTQWLNVVDLTNPNVIERMTINSVAGNAQLNLVAGGERRRIVGNSGGARLDFYGPADQPTAYISDTGDLYLPVLGNWVSVYMAGLQPALGFTPVRQHDANTIAIGADPPHLVLNNVDQGEFASTPAPFLNFDGLGSYAYMKSSSSVAAGGTVSGSKLKFYPNDEQALATGTWLNLEGPKSATALSVYHKVA